jgi:ribonuclease R
VIQSAHRLTYLEAQALIDGEPEQARKHAKTDAPHTEQLVEALRTMDALARAIRNRRLRDGMIVLDLPEVELIHDATGRVVDAQPEDDAFTHKLIEAFMVEANEAVARVFADLNIPLIRRIHPEPGAQDVSELRAFAQVAGYSIPAKPTRKELQKLLDSVRGTPAAKAVHFAVLRTLTKAEYSPDLIGHFALASEHYTHFTSPIRRYPDLAVHRALDALQKEIGRRKSIPREPHQRKILGNRVRSDRRVLDTPELRVLGRLCSGTERRAEAAERELRNLLVMQLLEKHVGDEFAGTVTGVTGFGVFIQIDKYLVDGIVKLRDLPGGPGESWSHQASAGALIARRSGHRISIGDTFAVRIVKVDLARREMDLQIIGQLKPARTPRPAEAGGRETHEKRRRAKTRKPGFFKGRKKKGARGRRR